MWWMLKRPDCVKCNQSKCESCSENNPGSGLTVSSQHLLSLGRAATSSQKQGLDSGYWDLQTCKNVQCSH